MSMNPRSLLGLIALVTTFDVNAGVIISSKDAPFSAIDAEEAKKIFLGREVSLSGLNVTVIFQKEGDTRTNFETVILGKTGADLTAYWSKLIFTGRAQAPVEVGSDSDVKAKVNSTPGAIGYISNGAADGSVKVLFKY